MPLSTFRKCRFRAKQTETEAVIFSIFVLEPEPAEGSSFNHFPWDKKQTWQEVLYKWEGLLKDPFSFPVLAFFASHRHTSHGAASHCSTMPDVCAAAAPRWTDVSDVGLTWSRRCTIGLRHKPVDHSSTIDKTITHSVYHSSIFLLIPTANDLYAVEFVWVMFQHTGRTVFCDQRTMPLCKAKRKYLLTCKWSRSCILALNGRMGPMHWK